MEALKAFRNVNDNAVGGCLTINQHPPPTDQNEALRLSCFNVRPWWCSIYCLLQFMAYW
jgi:hypothetical protein